MSGQPPKPPRNPFKNDAVNPPQPLRSPLLDAVAPPTNPFGDAPTTAPGNPFGEPGDSPRLNPNPNPFGVGGESDRGGRKVLAVGARGPSLLKTAPTATAVPVATATATATASPVFEKSSTTNPWSESESESESEPGSGFQNVNVNKASAAGPGPSPSPSREAFGAVSSSDDADMAAEKSFVRNSDVIPRQMPSVTQHMLDGTRTSIALALNQHDNKELSSNMIYYKNTLSDRWLIMAVAAHIIQWGILLNISRPQMTPSVFGFTVVLVVAVAVLLLCSRVFTTKRPRVDLRKQDTLTPEDEADTVRPIAVHMLATAAMIEGVAYAVFTASVAGKANDLASEGFRSQNTVVQVLQFASITFLTFHRSIRPSNRCDPLRTMLELEVVSVCWDALDGSTIFMLLNQEGLSPTVDTALRFLQCFWYLSVGARTAYMYVIHLPPTSTFYQLLITRPLQLATTPTVDRTLQSLRQRSVITLVMSLAELYAMCIRIYLWSKGRLDTLQIEMTVKNCMFLFQMYSAADMFFVTTRRDWNSRELGFGLQYPSREKQLVFMRVLFVSFYLVEGCLLSVICSHATQESWNWIGNFVLDIILCAVFYYYCQNCHMKMAHERRSWYLPQFSHVLFPTKLAVGMSCFMAANLFIARLPTLYSNADALAAASSDALWTYSNAMLVVMLSVVTIGAGGMYWYLSHMLFHKEFTASPGNYNAIHDPTRSMVAMSTQIEGALDVLSCVTLMQLAPLHLPATVNGAVQFFCLFELFNACQSFALGVTLAGGQDDTPLDLVKWKAWLRALRFLIDLGCFILRLVLWIRYNALSSVFLIKNLYNLLHTYAQIERYIGVSKYPKYTLFTESVPPQEWYGLTKQEWRDATRETVVAQAQAGRAV